MACGTPVIGANVGGIKYSVDDGKTGFLVAPKDPVALANKIERLLTDPSLMASMKKNAVKRVHKFFTWKIVAEAVRNLYENIIPAYRKQPQPDKRILLPEFSLKDVENVFNESFLPRLKPQ